MVYRSLSLALLLITIPSLFAQDEKKEEKDDNNLVENGSFEDFTGKLKKGGNIELATGWKSPNASKADLFSVTAPQEALVKAPKNQTGDQSPLTGNNYAGIRWYSLGNKQPRTYVQAKFKTMMRKGQKYCVKYYVSLADLSKFAANEIGAYITKIPLNKDDETSLMYEAQVPHLRSKIHEDMYSWQGVCGVYEATGGEQAIVIGNFKPSEKTTTKEMRLPKGETRGQLAQAYYYIDDVSVTPIKLASECSCEQIDKSESELIFSRKGVTGASMKNPDKIDQQVFYFKRFNKNVPPSMEPWVTEMAELMNAEPTLKVRLVGHIDETEKERTRMKPDLEQLGKDRAEAIKAALLEHGIEAARITTANKGSDQPADNTSSEVGQSKNRRVEVELVK
jgi:outer membrane protein OmpA-like peptidoglycan-associated protein